MRKPLILIAASGLAREAMAAVEVGDTYEVVGLLDDNVALHGTSVAGIAVLGGIEHASAHPDTDLVVCAGGSGARQKIIQRLSSGGVEAKRYATIVHPRAEVPRTCVVGIGSIILGNVALTSDVVIGQHVVLMPQAILTHDVRVGDFATLCAGVGLGGGVRIGDAAYLGMNSSVRQGLNVGARAVLGMGSVLLRDLPDDETWVGVPAAPILGRSASGTDLDPLGIEAHETILQITKVYTG